jgi:hypothetical protein
MLETLLRLLAERDTADTAELARVLGVNPSRIREMLGELVRLGYLREIAPGCADACEGCSLRPVCLLAGQARVWVLTAKGERFLPMRPSHREQHGR